jgi:DNA-binding PadR family transcriptional regulator
MSQALSNGTTSVVAPDLTASQQTILAILSEEARDGLAIKRELDTYDESDVNYERLYPNLNTLVEMGLVEKRKRDRRPNEYALTEAGHDAIVTRLSWVCSRFGTTVSRAEEFHDCVDAVQ